MCAHCQAKVGKSQWASSISFCSVVAELEILDSRFNHRMEGDVDPSWILCKKWGFLVLSDSATTKWRVLRCIYYHSLAQPGLNDTRAEDSGMTTTQSQPHLRVFHGLTPGWAYTPVHARTHTHACAYLQTQLPYKHPPRLLHHSDRK